MEVVIKPKLGETTTKKQTPTRPKIYKSLYILVFSSLLYYIEIIKRRASNTSTKCEWLRYARASAKREREALRRLSANIE